MNSLNVNKIEYERHNMDVSVEMHRILHSATEEQLKRFPFKVDFPDSLVDSQRAVAWLKDHYGYLDYKRYYPLLYVCLFRYEEDALLFKMKFG